VDPDSRPAPNSTQNMVTLTANTITRTRAWRIRMAASSFVLASQHSSIVSGAPTPAPNRPTERALSCGARRRPALRDPGSVPLRLARSVGRSAAPPAAAPWQAAANSILLVYVPREPPNAGFEKLDSREDPNRNEGERQGAELIPQSNGGASSC
jgi:hypothetical protein